MANSPDHADTNVNTELQSGLDELNHKEHSFFMKSIIFIIYHELFLVNSS